MENEELARVIKQVLAPEKKDLMLKVGAGVFSAAAGILGAAFAGREAYSSYQALQNGEYSDFKE